MPNSRQFWIGLIAIPLCIAVAVTITAAFGPLFGAWDWQATSFVLLIATSLVFLSLDGSVRGDDSPASRIAPGTTHLSSPGDFDSMVSAQMFQGTPEPQSRMQHLPASTAGWTRQALLTGTAAFAFLIILLA